VRLVIVQDQFVDAPDGKGGTRLPRRPNVIALADGLAARTWEIADGPAPPEPADSRTSKCHFGHERWPRSTR